MELKAKHAFDVYEDYTKTGDDDAAQVYIKADADEVISTIRAERDEYRYNLSCARNEIHNMQALMRDDIKTIANLKADYKEACDRLQTANLIKDEQLAATRHSKYTRCHDNAWRCRKLSNVYALIAYTHRGWKIAGYYDDKAKLYRKWNTRWLKIAEQFKDKEAK